MELHDSRSEWVAARLAAAKPEWVSNADYARMRLLAELSTARPAPRRKWVPALMTAIALLGIVVAMPQSRMAAQDLWYRWIVSRFDVVRLDLSRIPLDTSISTDGNTAMVPTDEAERKAGFRPVFPQSLGDVPAQVMVTGPIHVRQTVDVGLLRQALAKAGAGDVPVPAEWQGVTLRLEIRSMVIAEFPGDVQIIQALPFEFQAPSGFPLAEFAGTAFRCAGLSPWAARAMGEKFAANPSWLLDIPEDEVVVVEEISLHSGTGLLVSEPVESGGSRVTILFGGKDRVFAVVSNSREQGIGMANALR